MYVSSPKLSVPISRLKAPRYLGKITSSSFHRPATTTFGRNNYDDDNNQSNDYNRNDNSSYQRNKIQSGWR